MNSSSPRSASRDALLHARLQVASAGRSISTIHDDQLAETVLLASRVAEAFSRGNKVLVFGNGGSAGDAQHLAAEFIGRFRLERRSLPAIALTTDTSAITAIANDYDFSQIFSRQVEGLCLPGDVVIGISTSGRSENVLKGLKTARELGAATVLLCGRQPVPPGTADVVIGAVGTSTAEVQEKHLVLEHLLCDLVERALEAGLPLTQTVGPVTPATHLDLSSLTGFGAAARAQSQRVVWTNGVFDLLHPGHLALLREAAAQGEVLVVGLNSDASVRRLKGPARPIMSEDARAELLLSMTCVDAVHVFDEDTPCRAIEALLPDVHVKDSEYADRWLPERALLDRIGARMHFVSRVPRQSTTEIVARMQTPAVRA